MLSFSSLKTQHYVIIFGVLVAATYFSTKIKSAIGVETPEEDEYALIRKYLLTESPLYGYKRPKLWIHTAYEVNARKWRSFYSRNTTDLNEPFIHLTVGSIVNHCADDFNVCLIDDNSFERLIPNWKINVASLPEPFKERYRHIALMKILYFYGGILCPNTFLCLKNLRGLYDEHFSEKKGGGSGGDGDGAATPPPPFIFEAPNRSVCNNNGSRKTFVPSSYFMGCKKNCPVIKEILDKYAIDGYSLDNSLEAAGARRRVGEVAFSPEGDKTNMDFIDYIRIGKHYTGEDTFLGKCAEYLAEYTDNGKMRLLGGDLIGIKTKNGKAVAIEDLMGESFIGFSNNLLGIYIPNDEILRRIKYQWFATISVEELLAKSNSIIVKFFKASMVDYSTHNKTTNKTVVSI